MQPDSARRRRGQKDLTKRKTCLAMAPQIELVVPACALNGESPGWNPFFKKLFWVDIRGPALHAFDPATGKDECWEMPAWIGCQAPAPSGAVVALRTGLYDFNAKTGALILLAPPPFDPRRFIFNDGRCDPQGRFFVGPMYAPLAPDDQSRAPRAAPLWRFDPDATTSWTTATPLVATSNGLAWSPYGKTMYHSDTNSRMISAYDYDPATGSTDRRRLFAHVESEAEMGGPDGASVDSQGFYWCAVFASGCLLRFVPQVNWNAASSCRLNIRRCPLLAAKGSTLCLLPPPIGRSLTKSETGDRMKAVFLRWRRRRRACRPPRSTWRETHEHNRRRFHHRASSRLGRP